MLHTVGEIKAGNARFHALLQVDLRSFIKTLDVSRPFTHSRCSHICFFKVFRRKQSLGAPD